MYKVVAGNESEQVYADLMENVLNNDIYPKLIGATFVYGEKVINYLIETKQYDSLHQAINGTLDEENIKMDKDAYDRIYGAR